MTERTIYWKCKKSGWKRILLHLSDYNFDRLDHGIVGVPIYYNDAGDIWPKPVEGIEIERPDMDGFVP